MLAYAYSLLNKNGEMLIINQTESEAKAQKELLDKLNISYQELGEIASNYFQYNYTRYGFLIKKL